jgi:hypothetical protein
MKQLPMDPLVADWLREGTTHGPSEGLQRALDATRTVSQRPGWTFLRRWLPGPLADAQLTFPLPAGVTLMLLLSLLLLIGLAAAMVATRPPPIRLPLGPSAEVLVAYQEGASIVAARIDGSDGRLVSGAVDYARSPVFSPDGSRIAFVAPRTPDALGGRLLVVPVDGSGPAIDVSQGIEVWPSSVPQISWSPDGSQIAFAGEQDGVATIFVGNGDGSGVAPITDQLAQRDLPSWSPDGNWIAYRATEPDGLRRHLEMTRPDGSEVQQVTTVIAEDANLSRLDWSPINDSLSYAMNVGFGTQSRAVIDLRFTHTNEPWSDGIGGWFEAGVPFSPDGTQLAILTADNGLIVADYDQTGPEYEGEVRQLGPLVDCWVDWSPDGTALYGGSPDDCTATVVIPLADPQAAVTLPMSGVASWQPLER